MGCRKDLILQVDKKQKAPTEPAADLYAFGEAAF
jgi:hypothetical protein